MRGKNHWLKLHIWASVWKKHTLCLRKDYPVSAALGWRWNRLLNVQMFHVLSWGSVICWILCFSLPHPVIPRSPYHWVFLLCLTFVPLASYCCSGTEDPGQSKGYGCSLPLKSGALAVDQVVYEKRCLWNAEAWRTMYCLWLTFTIFRVKKKKDRSVKCEALIM